LSRAETLGHERSIVELYRFRRSLIQFCAEASRKYGPRPKIPAKRMKERTRFGSASAPPAVTMNRTTALNRIERQGGISHGYVVKNEQCPEGKRMTRKHGGVNDTERPIPDHGAPLRFRDRLLPAATTIREFS